MKKMLVMLTVLVTMLAVSSCSKKTDSQSLVPEDAAIVMRLDLLQLGQKSGLSGGESTFVKQLKKQLRNAGIGREIREKLEEIIDEPSQSGIDLTDPFFLYASLDKRGDPKEVGFIGTIASESKLTDLLNAINEEVDDFPEVESEDGMKYIDLMGASLIYNDSWFFMGRLEGDISDQVATLKDRTDGKGSLSGNEAYERLCEKEGLAQMLIMMSGFSEVRDFKDAAQMLPDGLDFDGLAGLIDFAMDNGEATLTSEYICLTDEWKEQMDKFDDMLGPLDGALVKYVSGKGLSAFANIDLTKYLDSMKGFLESQGIDDETMKQIKSLTSSIKGDMVFDLRAVNDGMPVMCGYMSTKNGDIIALLEANSEENDDFVKVGDHVFAIPFSYDYEDVYDSQGNWIDWERKPKAYMTLGYLNNVTFMATGDIEPLEKPAHSFNRSDIKGKGLYMNFNFDFLNDVAQQTDNSNAKVMREVAKVLDYAELYVDGDKGVFRLVTHETDETPLQTLISYLEKFMTRM